MEEFITDERTGLRYELVGDYYLIAGEEEPEGRPIGIWGQRHLRYIRKHKVSLYAELLTTGKLNDYLADLNEQAEAMFSRLVKQLSEKEGVTEEASVCGNVTIYGGKVSNTTCLFALVMILLVCVPKRLKRGDIFAERQQ